MGSNFLSVYTFKRFVIYSIIFLFFSSFAYAQNKLIFLTEEWKPFNFTNDEKSVDGFTTEIVRRIAKELGSDISIFIKPWSRSYDTVLKNKDHAIFSIYRTSPRENLFKWVGPVYKVDTVLWGMENRDLKINSLEDARKYRVIVQRDSAYEQAIIDKGFKNYYLNASRTDAHMVLAGRGDLTVASALSLEKLKKAAIEINMPHAKWKAYITLYSKPFYIGFNKETPDHIVNKWQTELDKIKNLPFYWELERKFIKPISGKVD